MTRDEARAVLDVLERNHPEICARVRPLTPEQMAEEARRRGGDYSEAWADVLLENIRRMRKPK